MASEQYSKKYRRTIFMAPDYKAAIQIFDRLILTGFPKKDIFLVGKKIQDTTIEESIFWDFGNGGIQRTPLDQALMRVLWKQSSGFELGWEVGRWVGFAVGILTRLSLESWFAQVQVGLLVNVAYTLISAFF